MGMAPEQEEAPMSKVLGVAQAVALTRYLPVPHLIPALAAWALYRLLLERQLPPQPRPQLVVLEVVVGVEVEMEMEMRALEVVVVMVMVTQAIMVAAVEVTMGLAEGPSMVLLIPRR